MAVFMQQHMAEAVIQSGVEMPGHLAAMTLADIVDVFTDSLEQDSLTTFMLSCMGLANSADGAVLTTDNGSSLSVAVASKPAVWQLMDKYRLSGQSSLEECRANSTAVVGAFRPADTPFEPYVLDCLNLGFHFEYLFPMSHRNTVTGVLVLLDRNELALDAERLSLIASMAKVAGSLLVQSRQLDRSQTLASQLQSALQSRVLIEQAKGVVAERTHSDMHTAFQILRQQARNEGRVLADVAKDIINQREAMMNTQKEMKSSYLNGGSL